LRSRRTVFVAVLFVLAAVPRDAQADVFLAPSFTWSFQSDYLEQTRQGWGVTFGATGAFVGFEIDWSRTNDFFTSEDQIAHAAPEDSRVQTIMFNLLITIPTGRAKPYLAGGAGVIQSRLTSDLSLLGFDDSGIGFNFGGGILGYFTSHVGVRADLRYFRTVTDLFKDNPLDIDFGGLNFWRSSVGVALKF
jgi:opacity protein-like surface antigen